MPTYNRPGDLRKFITEISKQTYPWLNVYIVDDASSVELESIIPVSSCISYIKLDTNRGQTYARNFALRNYCKGDIVILLDDDAWFTDHEAIEKVVNYFTDNLQLGAVMFDLEEPGKKLLSSQRGLRDREKIGSFIACACAFSRRALIEVKGFTDFLHSYGEETDLTLKLFSNKYDIIFSSQVLVYHNYLPGKRDMEWYLRFRKNSTRNDLLIILMRFPWFLVPPFFIGKFLSNLIYTIRSGRNLLSSTTATFKGLLSALALSKKAIMKRESISYSTFKIWYKLRW